MSTRSRTGAIWAASLFVVTAAYVAIGSVDARAREDGARRVDRGFEELRLALRDAQARQLLQTERLVAGQEKIAAAIAALGAVRIAAGEEAPPPAPSSTDLEEAPVEQLDLPLLPEELDPRIARQIDLESFLADRRLNPAGKVPDRLGRARIYGEFLRTRHAMEEAEHEFHEGLIEAAYEMQADAAYVELAPDEAPAPAEPGLISAAAPGLDSTRMFYFDRERFADLYQVKEKPGEVGALGLRRAMAILDESPDEP